MLYILTVVYITLYYILYTVHCTAPCQASAKTITTPQMLWFC
jgi:hypothetical protein